MAIKFTRPEQIDTPMTDRIMDYREAVAFAKKLSSAQPDQIFYVYERWADEYVVTAC